MDIQHLSCAAGLRLIALIAAHLASRDNNIALVGELDEYVRLSSGRMFKFDERELEKVAFHEYKSRRLREKFFDLDLFAEPAWDILLDLFIQTSRGRKISVTSACIASNVAPTTALRWLNFLEEKGLLELEIDKADRRRRIVSMTEAGKKKMLQYLSREASNSYNARLSSDLNSALDNHRIWESIK